MSRRKSKRSRRSKKHRVPSSCIDPSRDDMTGGDSFSLLRKNAQLERRKEICKASNTLREACARWNSWQYKQARKGNIPTSWRIHNETVKGLTEGVMGGIAEKEHAVVLGAGICNEVPLRKMCEQFSRVTLVDIDSSSMEFAVSGLRPRELGRKVEMIEADVSLMLESLVGQVERALELPDISKKEAKDFITALITLAGINPNQNKLFSLGDNSANFVMSSDVLPCMTTMPLSWMDTCCEEKFKETFRLVEMPLIHPAVKAHLAEIGRILKPSSARAFLETCIATGPIVNGEFMLQMRHPETGKPVFSGLPIFGYDPIVLRAVELNHLLSLMPSGMIASKHSLKQWMVATSGQIKMQTSVGPVSVFDGSIFQSVVLAKSLNQFPDP